jgi:mannan endo-1,4-beta-mannosidase
MPRTLLHTLVAAVVLALVTPVEPAAAARPDSRLLAYLNQISGQRTISGQHNREPNSDPTKWTRAVRDITGETPGLWGGDFLFLPDDVNNRQTMVDEALRQWQAGSVVTLTWHMCPPTIGSTCGWDEGGILGSLSDGQWTELLRNGSGLNNAWKRRLDEVVPHLRRLQNAGVEVLWRPLHEMNEGWSWWGGRGAQSRQLYQLTRDYLVGQQGLDSLIWVWNVKDVNMGSIGTYWPGASYVDVASLDVWVKMEPSGSDYQAMLNVAGGKPIALGEIGRVPSPQLLAAQPRWTWFMVWAEWLVDPAYNNNAAVQRTYWDGRVLNRSEINLGTPPGGNNLASGRPVFASSQESAAHAPGLAVDGNTGTRWSSAFADPQWIYVDLGANRTVTSVTLRWEAAYASMYQIQLSTDGTTWTTVHNDNAGNGGTDTINLGQRTARYVKLYAWQRATPWGYSLWELEVQGS